jgi:hypothetical protein
MALGRWFGIHSVPVYLNVSWDFALQFRIRHNSEKEGDWLSLTSDSQENSLKLRNLKMVLNLRVYLLSFIGHTKSHTIERLAESLVILFKEDFRFAVVKLGEQGLQRGHLDVSNHHLVLLLCSFGDRE